MQHWKSFDGSIPQDEFSRLSQMLRTSLLTFLLFMMGLLVSCGLIKDEGTPVAKVKEEVLTLEQLRSRGIVEKMPMMESIEEWVNEEVLIQEALASGLDKDPEVSELLKRARRKILLDAYLLRFSASVKEPEEGELEAFFESHRKEYLRETQDVRISKVVFPVMKQASDVYKSRDKIAWGDLRMRMDSTLTDSSENSLPWKPIESLSQCEQGIVATLARGSLSLPQMCDGSPVILKLHGKKNIGDPLEYRDARPKVLQTLRKLKKDAKLDSLLREVKSRMPVFTWPEHLSNP